MQKNLPAEFAPKIIKGYAIGGICQVSLSAMRPAGMPKIVGTASHNAAHRIAVHSSKGDGVFVTRRDTNSVLNTISGGRFFPGAYAKADFQVSALNNRYAVTIFNEEQSPIMSIAAEVVSELTEGSVFSSIVEVSDFFKQGNIGWSSVEGKPTYDSIELVTDEWRMEPLKVTDAYSSYFSNTDNFPV